MTKRSLAVLAAHLRCRGRVEAGFVASCHALFSGVRKVLKNPEHPVLTRVILNRNRSGQGRWQSSPPMRLAQRRWCARISLADAGKFWYPRAFHCLDKSTMTP